MFKPLLSSRKAMWRIHCETSGPGDHSLTQYSVNGSLLNWFPNNIGSPDGVVASLHLFTKVFSIGILISFLKVLTHHHLRPIIGLFCHYRSCIKQSPLGNQCPNWLQSGIYMGKYIGGATSYLQDKLSDLWIIFSNNLKVPLSKDMISVP